MSAAIPEPPDKQIRLDTLAGTPIRNSSGRTTPWLSWSLVAMLTAALTCFSTYHAIRGYEELRSGWSWDLAYYNQWFWALTKGDGILTVRPVSAYAQEGPSIWKMNYLAPIRLALVPLYRLAPDPVTLLLIQNVMFWWVIPAAYTLVRSETDSELAALSAAALVPFTPLVWPLVWNDFRELQLAGPFVLWAVQGIRSRSAGWATLGIAGMLACRQEYAVMVATFAFIPPRDRESLGLDAVLAPDHLPGRSALADGRVLRLSKIRRRLGRSRLVYRAVHGPEGTFQPGAVDITRNSRAGDGGLGRIRMPGPSGGDLGVALDLGPMQREVGDALALDLGMSQRSLRDADGGNSASRRFARLRASGELVKDASGRRPGSPGDGVGLCGHFLRGGPARPRQSHGTRPGAD